MFALMRKIFIRMQYDKLLDHLKNEKLFPEEPQKIKGEKGTIFAC